MAEGNNDGVRLFSNLATHEIPLNLRLTTAQRPQRYITTHYTG